MTGWVWRRIYRGVVTHAWDDHAAGRASPPAHIVYGASPEQVEREEREYAEWARSRTACGSFSIVDMAPPELANAARERCPRCVRAIRRITKTEEENDMATQSRRNPLGPCARILADGKPCGDAVAYHETFTRELAGTNPDGTAKGACHIPGCSCVGYVSPASTIPGVTTRSAPAAAAASPIRGVACGDCGALPGHPCLRPDGTAYKRWYHPARMTASGVPTAGAAVPAPVLDKPSVPAVVSSTTSAEGGDTMAIDTTDAPTAGKPKRAKRAKANGKSNGTAKRTRKAATSTKAADAGPQPTGKVKSYIDDLRTTPEKRYATKEWKRLAGHRATRPTPFDLAPARANTIRDDLAGLVGKAKD